MALPKHPFIYKSVIAAMQLFGKRHSVSERQHFAPLLGYNGPNDHIQLSSALNYTTYNPYKPKPLSIDQLVVLIEELGPDARPIMDALAKKAGGVFVTEAQAAASHDDVRDELLQIAALAGDLSQQFLTSLHNDGVIDDLEAEELARIAYEARRQIKAFENMIEQAKQPHEEE
ncbi:phage regulatory CII family protein [Sulfurimonas sp. HSL1-6]|uniref:phage regulatory CII family protein n=1 Tax=Sulfurimonadaceae TaxID=2771471 RepID=UPI0031F84998